MGISSTSNFVKTCKMKFLFSLLATVLAVKSAQKRQFDFSKSRGLLMDNELGVPINLAVVYVGNPPTDECPKYGGVDLKSGRKKIPMGDKCKIDRITVSAAFKNRKGVRWVTCTPVGTGRACLVWSKNNQPDPCVVTCA